MTADRAIFDSMKVQVNVTTEQEFDTAKAKMTERLAR